MEATEKVFMAVAVDDDFDLHPKNKRLPATRLGWAAASMVYGLERPVQVGEGRSHSIVNSRASNKPSRRFHNHS